MTQHQPRHSATRTSTQTAEAELAHDRRNERLMLLRGVLALLVVLVVVAVRQYWLI